MKSLNQSYTVDLRVNYVFNLFCTPDFMGNTRMLSSLIVFFKGLQELDFEPKVDSEHRFAIVPPLLRNNCGRGSLVIAEVRKIPLSKKGNKIAEYAIQLMSMKEL